MDIPEAADEWVAVHKQMAGKDMKAVGDALHTGAEIVHKEVVVIVHEEDAKVLHKDAEVAEQQEAAMIQGMI